MSAVTVDALEFDTLRALRAERPHAVQEALATRRRRDIVRGDGRLFIVAADHPARGALSVGDRDHAMASRYLLLQRLAVALSHPGVDGVLGTPDIIDDLAQRVAMGGTDHGKTTGLEPSICQCRENLFC